MRKLLVIFFTLAFFAGQAQILQPTKWQYQLSTTNYKPGDTIELIFKVTIDKDWHLYSSDFSRDLGPMVTTFTFEPNDTYELIDSIRAINPKKGYDEIFEGDYTYFVGTGEFRQTIKVLKSNLHFDGDFEYQVCSDIDGRCIPFDTEFSQHDFGISTQLEKKSELSSDTGYKESENLLPEERGLWGFMLFAFITGLLALVTPCVFPMIPMTVTFFLKEQEKGGNGRRKAIAFGLFIVFIFTVLGTLTAFLLGAETLNELATEWWLNLGIFIIFFVFALSFLGLFEITLPHQLVNKIDAQSDRGGLIGVFFMAFTLALISFSCTFPIVGSVLVLSAQGEFVKPILGMLSFSLAFALPFTLFAFFPDWLKKMPKSGGWLNSVKVVLGLAELALGLKFLSVADQAYHWHILDREVYLALWIVIFGIMGLYLLGKIKLPHDSPLEHVGVLRLLFAIITFSFVVYLIPGLWGAPLKGLSGYLPPLTTQDFTLSDAKTIQLPLDKSSICEAPKYADFLHFPHELQGYFDYTQAIACAREQNKPLFIDFTGHGCVNCREMEARVWSDPRVLQRLRDDFVLVALYVDDRTTLPESDWYTSTYDNKVKKTIGKQNADFQISRYNNNAQPFYVILNKDEKMVIKPRAYDLSVDGFISFLDEASRRYKEGETFRKELN
ncbi:MAG: thioredoxin family protein [Cyclobacteriaceae bacterium]|nr:thioredoxin family protein [Cyclobacteriaceae bacterium]